MVKFVVSSIGCTIMVLGGVTAMIWVLHNDRPWVVICAVAFLVVSWSAFWAQVIEQSFYSWRGNVCPK